jgi:hypothetical protein
MNNIAFKYLSLYAYMADNMQNDTAICCLVPLNEDGNSVNKYINHPKAICLLSNLYNAVKAGKTTHNDTKNNTPL